MIELRLKLLLLLLCSFNAPRVSRLDDEIAGEINK